MLLIEGKAKSELLSSKPYSDTYDSVAGGRDDYMKVTAILDDGNQEELKDCGRAEYAANDVQNQEWDCPTIAQQIAKLGNVKGLIVEAQEYCSWEASYEDDITQEEFADGLPIIDNGQGYKAYCPIEPIDWTKVRRRLEDRLRKDPEALRTCVAALNLKLW